MSLRRLPAVVVACFAAFAGRSLAAQKLPPGTVVDGEPGKAYEAALAADAPTFWGAVLACHRGKVVFAHGYGLQDHQRTPFGPRTVVDIGGLGRLLTLLCAVQLQAQGKWSLDDPIGRVVPGVPKDKAAISLRQLALHTSGMPAEVAFAGGAADARRTAVEAMLAAPLAGVPGRVQLASPRNDNLLAAAIELAAGESFEAAVQRRVCQPLGLRDTGFLRELRVDDARLSWRRPPGQTSGRPVTEGGFDWAARGAMGVLSTPYDLHALVAALVADKPFGKEAPLWSAPFAGGDLYSVRTIEIGGQSLVQWHGAASGYRTRLVVHRPSQSWLVLCAGEVQLDAIAARLGAVLVRSVVAAAPAGPGGGAAAAGAPSAPTQATPNPDLERFVGVFGMAGGGSLTVQRQGDQLLVRPVGIQAVTRLTTGRWPGADKVAPLERAADRGIVWLDGLAKDAAATLRSANLSAEAAAATQAAWDALRARLPNAPGWECVGIETGARTGWFRSRAKDGYALVRLGFGADGRVQSLLESREPPPFRAMFRLVRRDVAVATIGDVQASLTVEGEGASRVLVLEDGTAGAAGLIECRWSGSLR